MLHASLLLLRRISALPTTRANHPLAAAVARADELWRHLDEMGVQPEVEHPRLGKPSALLEELIRKR